MFLGVQVSCDSEVFLEEILASHFIHVHRNLKMTREVEK